MIRRSPHVRNYVQISNTVAEDSRLSWKALGLLTYLLSRPDNWKTNDRQLASTHKCGREAVQSGLKELEEAGYLVRTRHRGDDGKFVWESVIFESPQVKNSPVEEEPWPGFPAMVYPATENPANKQDGFKKTEEQRYAVDTAQGEPSDEEPLPPPPATPFDAVKVETPSQRLRQVEAEAQRLYEAFRAVRYPREIPGTWPRREWLDALPTLRQWVIEGRTCTDVGAVTREAIRREFKQVTIAALARNWSELHAAALPPSSPLDAAKMRTAFNVAPAMLSETEVLASLERPLF